MKYRITIEETENDVSVLNIEVVKEGANGWHSLGMVEKLAAASKLKKLIKKLLK